MLWFLYATCRCGTFLQSPHAFGIALSWLVCRSAPQGSQGVCNEDGLCCCSELHCIFMNSLEGAIYKACLALSIATEGWAWNIKKSKKKFIVLKSQTSLVLSVFGKKQSNWCTWCIYLHRHINELKQWACFSDESRNMFIWEHFSILA